MCFAVTVITEIECLVFIERVIRLFSWCYNVNQWGTLAFKKERRQIPNGQCDGKVTIMLERLTVSEREVGENETRQANERKGVFMKE